jgi:hypothetical protein
LSTYDDIKYSLRVRAYGSGHKSQQSVGVLTLRCRPSKAVSGSLLLASRIPSKAREDPNMPNTPDQENMEAQMVAKRVKPKL